jgi:GNAT superfamily N-acetyltransferase
VTVRPLREDDLDAADLVCRTAFGTFVGAPEPHRFFGDAEPLRNRWRADPEAAFAAERDGVLVGSNLLARWGSFGYFGPLSVRPDLWGAGVAKRLLEATMDLFTTWGTPHLGLFTFAHSAKHVGLYRRFGFFPRFLTVVMAKPVTARERLVPEALWSTLGPDAREATLQACGALTGAILDGLDVGPEIRAVAALGLGETVLVRDEAGLAGLAVCHCGPGTEAGRGACYVKFGAARPGPGAPRTFERLLDACEALAAERGLGRLVAGVNTERADAWSAMLARGFRTEIQGVAMLRPNEPGHNRPDVFVCDDWR